MDDHAKRLGLGDKAAKDAIAQIEMAKQFPLKAGKIVVSAPGRWHFPNQNLDSRPAESRVGS